MGYERPGPKKFQGPICHAKHLASSVVLVFPFCAFARCRLSTLSPRQISIAYPSPPRRPTIGAATISIRPIRKVAPILFFEKGLLRAIIALHIGAGRPTRPGAISLLRGSQPAGLRAPARAKPLIARALRFADLLDIGRGRPGLRRAAAEPGRPRRVCRRNHPPPQPRRHAASGDGSPRAMSGRQG